MSIKTTDMNNARAEATQELASALLQTAGEVMKRHGSDPHSPAIVAAGFAMALDRIGRHIDQKIPETVRVMLNTP